MKLKAIDLFAGAGGLGLGAERAGIDIVLANEMEKNCAKTYQANHPKTKVITAPLQQIDISLCKHSKADIVMGGPPCQGFSTVGSKNLDDPRNGLFIEFLRIVEAVKPKWVLFENVAGFKNLYKGVIYHEFIKRITALGYRANAAVIDAVEYGLPQYRKRTIIFAWAQGQQPITFPRPTHGDALFLKPKNNLWDAISDLPALYPNQCGDAYISAPLNHYQSVLRQKSTVLTEHGCANYGAKMQKILSLIPAGGSIDDIPKALRPKNYFKNTYARLVAEQPAPTITRNFGTPSSSRCVHPVQNRALSTREGARLQSFPDSYVFYGSKGMKNLQIGNAVPPSLAKTLAQSIVQASQKI